jgi:hypothetical protein
LIMGDPMPLQPQNPHTPPGQGQTGRRTHGTNADHDDIVIAHGHRLARSEARMSG